MLCWILITIFQTPLVSQFDCSIFKFLKSSAYRHFKPTCCTNLHPNCISLTVFILERLSLLLDMWQESWLGCQVNQQPEVNIKYQLPLRSAVKPAEWMSWMEGVLGNWWNSHHHSSAFDLGLMKWHQAEFYFWKDLFTCKAFFFVIGESRVCREKCALVE